jgi:regulator of protease activity HflC (stomatin/prohibitin superfamily)
MHTPLMIFIGFIVLYFLSCIKVLREYERGVIFRLGRLLPAPKGPGLIFIFKPIDKMVRISLRLIALDVPPQDIITRDNVSVQVNAVVYFRVMDANKAITEVENYGFATSQMAQTTLRSVIGERELDELLSSREEINAQIQGILDKQTDPWGIKVSNVEIKHVDLTDELKRAMARQAEAERERRAKIINAEGEHQAAENLVAAATMMKEHPMAMQMKYLQTLVDISSSGNNTTTIFPIPIDLFKPFLKG